jgi:hypothetical protein
MLVMWTVSSMKWKKLVSVNIEVVVSIGSGTSPRIDFFSLNRLNQISMVPQVGLYNAPFLIVLENLPKPINLARFNQFQQTTSKLRRVS